LGRFYGEKVKNDEIKLEDVPRLWRKMAEKWLEANR
jgi:hypothetical protein